MSKGATIVEGLAILFLMQFTGELISRMLRLPLPGNLTGLLLLFFLLCLGVIRMEQVEDAANLLLDNMMLLFIPLNAGLMTIFPLLKKEGLAIIISLLLSTVLVMAVTAKTVEFIKRGKERDAGTTSNSD